LFSTFLELGVKHILDINAYDHLLFIVVLACPFAIKNWKQVIILATAFTVGHSITLILSTLDIIRFPTQIVEFLIPCTILATALFNLFGSKLSSSTKSIRLQYLIAALFGLIHGMGFSNFLRASLLPGEEKDLFVQLLAFNIGIELAQIIIILLLLIVLYILSKTIKLSQNFWITIWSNVGAIASIYLMIQTWPL